MNIQASTSEDNGIAALTDTDLEILSVGISTGGVAEIRMAQDNPQRHIVATTIDKEGVSFAQKYIAEQHLEQQIQAKIEDVSQPLPYDDNHFDYIYARLVLHYLSKEALQSTLRELHRVLKSGGKVFVVVRSTKCPDATAKDAQYDPETGLTTRTSINPDGTTHSYSRYFHTEDSISTFVRNAGFSVAYVKSYDEVLFKDFMRTIAADHTDNVIELLANK